MLEFPLSAPSGEPVGLRVQPEADGFVFVALRPPRFVDLHVDHLAVDFLPDDFELEFPAALAALFADSFGAGAGRFGARVLHSR